MDAQNSGTPRQFGRPWNKGQSGNPGGRPKGLGESVRKLVGNDGEKLIQALLAIAVGKAEDRKKLFGAGVRVSLRDRLEAIKQLCDRGWGKPIQSIEHSGPDGGPIESTGLSAEEIAARAEALAKRLRNRT